MKIQYDTVYVVKKNNYKTLAVIYFDALGDAKVSVLDAIEKKFKQYTSRVFTRYFKSAEEGVELFDLVNGAIQEKKPLVTWVQLKQSNNRDYQIKFAKIRGATYVYACKTHDRFDNEIIMSGYNGKEYNIDKAVFAFDLSEIISDESTVPKALERKYEQLVESLKTNPTNADFKGNTLKRTFEEIFADFKEYGIIRETDKAIVKSIIDYMNEDNDKHTKVSADRILRIKDTVVALHKALEDKDRRIYFSGVERVRYSNDTSELYYKFRVAKNREEDGNQIVILFSSEDKFRNTDITTNKALRNGNYVYVVTNSEKPIKKWDIMKSSEIAVLTGTADNFLIMENKDTVLNMEKYINMK